jgi:hypothetical protein
MTSRNLHNQGGCIVPAVVGEGFVYESVGWIGGVPTWISWAEMLEDVVIVKAFRKSVGAKEESVAGFVVDGADLGIRELIAAAECFLEHISPGMGACFPWADHSVAEQPTDVGVVLG